MFVDNPPTLAGQRPFSQAAVLLLKVETYQTYLDLFSDNLNF